MATFVVNIFDGNGGTISLANIILLDANGVEIPDPNSLTGQPIFFTADSNGQAVFNNDNGTVSAKVVADNYTDQTVTLTPGINRVTLAGVVNGPEVTITANRPGNWFSNNKKTILFLVIAVALVYLAIKFKIFSA